MAMNENQPTAEQARLAYEQMQRFEKANEALKILRDASKTNNRNINSVKKKT